MKEEDISYLYSVGRWVHLAHSRAAKNRKRKQAVDSVASVLTATHTRDEDWFDCTPFLVHQQPITQRPEGSFPAHSDSSPDQRTSLLRNGNQVDH